MTASDLPSKLWTLTPAVVPPGWMVAQVGEATAQLLVQRGLKTPDAVTAFCQPDAYQPTEPWAFPEMRQAVDRLLLARESEERVTIWGDFDADGVTATAVLLEGLAQFLSPQQLNFYIPNRLTESHGLSVEGVKRLQAEGTTLIVTCDTGSTSLAAIAAANQLGVDVIITDHHTLPSHPLDAIATLNPRQFSSTHPLASLSGVAVAYKFVEALYLAVPEIPTRPLADLLDLVAIGLVADLVNLKGDVRYLAQLGIQQLKKQSRPGVRLLLENCKRAGDRAMDIAFGLGPRINAVSRIHGDATFCVRMLVESDLNEVKPLVEQTELANTRRKGMQASVKRQALEHLESLDLSTDSAIVLASRDWSAGVLGIVAGELARDYQRPTFVFRVEDSPNGEIAMGSARSVAGIDLYRLLELQQDLLVSFGGHPLAAGLRLAADNLPLLRQRLNHTLRQLFPNGFPAPELAIDLEVSVNDLGQDLFRQLRQLEPYGMGNPIPRLLVRGVKFDEVRNRNSKDASGQTVRYIYTTFRMRDRASNRNGHSINGIWWGHRSHELPQGLCDAVVELDYMGTQRERQGSRFAYQVRLIDVRLAENPSQQSGVQPIQVIDCRGLPEGEIAKRLVTVTDPVVLTTCPDNWTQLLKRMRSGRPLVLAYDLLAERSPNLAWITLVGWAKSLLKVGEDASVAKWSASLQVSAATLGLGLDALQSVGFVVKRDGDCFTISAYRETVSFTELVAEFERTVAEEIYLQRYFFESDVGAIDAVLNQPIGRSSSTATAGQVPFQ
ncbi:MAG: single-stranded-DNA-specific exonuclease RecJ [Synechococcus sp.]